MGKKKIIKPLQIIVSQHKICLQSPLPMYVSQCLFFQTCVQNCVDVKLEILIFNSVAFFQRSFIPLLSVELQ